jgi:hypothetical protein
MKILIFLVILLSGWTTTANAIEGQWHLPPLSEGVLPLSEDKPFYQSDKKLISEFTAEISAYTAGRKEENDSDPCIGAWNNDICQMVKDGKLVFANNYYKNGTIVCIDTIGCGEVRDRMNSRYGKSNFDLAGLDLKKNLEFGRKNLTVRVYKK